MQGQTTITYGEVLITNCVTEQFQQEAVYSPDGSHLMYHKFTVVVSGYSSGEQRTSGTTANPWRQNSFMAGGTPVAAGNLPDPTRQMVWIRSHLEKPRLRFQMRTGVKSNPSGLTFISPTSSAAANQEGEENNGGGSILLDALPYPASPVTEWLLASPTTDGPGTDGGASHGDGSGYDLNNGPKCVHCDITKIIANDLFLVRAAFEVCKLECSTGDGRAEAITKGVLSNRWSMEDDLDANLMTTRRTHGQLRVTTPYLEPNSFRGWVIPSLQQGFRRESMKFQVTEDGLHLGYTITDKEIAFSAPQPALTWNYKHSESITNQTMVQTTVDVHLTGNRDTPKTELFRTAAAIAQAKTKFLTVPFRGIIHDITCVDEYGDNANSVTLRVVVSRAKQADEFGGVNVFTMGVPLKAADFVALVNGVPLQPLATDYNRNQSFGAYLPGVVAVEGQLPALAGFAKYLISTCSDEHKLNESIESLGDYSLIADARNDYELSAEVVTSLPTNPVTYLDTTVFSSDQKESDYPYTHWQCDSTIKQNKTRVQLPIAAQSSYFTGGSNVATSSVVALGGDVTERIVRFKGTRVGRVPKLPSPSDDIPYSPAISGANSLAKILDVRLRPFVTDKTVDGQDLHTVEGEFTYAIPVTVFGPTGALVQLFTGWNPWEDQTVAKKATPAGLMGGPTP